MCEIDIQTEKVCTSSVALWFSMDAAFVGCLGVSTNGDARSLIYI